MTARVIPSALILVILIPLSLLAQTDPGVRPGAAGAGPALSSVLANNPTTILDFFNDGKGRFQEVDSVFGTVPGEPGFGLGPRFNSRSCAACHAQPAIGGSAPGHNPQVVDAGADGARNIIPTFIIPTGPVREARFPFFFTGGVPDLSRPDGSVQDLFTIANRSDSAGCSTVAISQPDFANAQAQNNIIFRIPTPVFGAGLIENIEETSLLDNLAAQSGNTLGINGTFNRNGNDGTISRFGWKAQNKSLEIFAGEAYNVEMGVSNELFTQERPLSTEEQASGLPPICKLNATPEDHTNFNTTSIDTMSDTVQFAMFMRLLAPPVPSTTVPGGGTSIVKGNKLFESIGCIVCHTEQFSTNPSSITDSLHKADLFPFSDFEIHHMGTTLADNVSQGTAGGDQFRTAPLWGVGQRIFFLHDGRTTDLLAAIAAHSSSGSEATQTVVNFNALAFADKQNLLNFLRSL
ncbi:MAG: di-heme oxidoredictase family protein [Thermoanaerobaculia bacterium]